MKTETAREALRTTPIRSVMVGFGGHLPERIVTNAELSRRIDTSDEWIVERTGIHERRIAAEGELASDLGAEAARAALADAGIAPEAVDGIVLATSTPDQTYPATAIYPSAGDTLKAFSGYMDADGGVALNFASFLVRDSGTTILVDTGWGPEPGGQLPAEMKAAGIDLATVDVVAFTHLHGDHTGWNIDRATGKPYFMVREPMRRSQHAAMLAPPPVQAPWIAATVGTRQRSIAVITRSRRAS